MSPSGAARPQPANSDADTGLIRMPNMSRIRNDQSYPGGAAPPPWGQDIGAPHLGHVGHARPRARSTITPSHLDGAGTERLSGDNRRVRIIAGLERAKAQGVRLGRPRIPVDMDRALAMRAKGWSLEAIGRALGTSAMTISRALANAKAAATVTTKIIRTQKAEEANPTPLPAPLGESDAIQRTLETREPYQRDRAGERRNGAE